MPTSLEQFANALRIAAPAFDIALRDEDIHRLTNYYDLVLKWNPRLHLVAPCSPKEFATRHVLESLTLLKHLPLDGRVIDIGSGAGLPMIPCLLLRKDLRATLIESSQKKVVFLRQALREAKRIDRAKVIGQRFEDTKAPDAEFITCRALDRFEQLLPAIIRWAPAPATFLFFAGKALRSEIESRLKSAVAEQIPLSAARFLIAAHSE